METNINRSLYLKLRNEVDNELTRENPDTKYIKECVDAMLRLLSEKSYQITAQQREENIQRILSNIPQKKKLSKVAKILLAAAIIMILLVCSVFAYTIIEYNINDYGTYSEVWANITSKKIDKPVEVGYVPEGFELAGEENFRQLSRKTYFNNDDFVTVGKSIIKYAEVNTEYRKAYSKVIDGTEYIIYGEENHGKSVIWFSKDYRYTVNGSFSDDKLLEIAQTVS